MNPTRPAALLPSPATDRRGQRLSRLYRSLWFGRVEGRAPAMGGGLVLAAHYNGAVDGFLYGSQLPPFSAVVAAQWHRTGLGRFLLPGITVERRKDGVTGAANLSAFRRILTALQAGRRVLFFPEGTSRLGEERLPIQPGTLLLLRQLRRSCPEVPVYFAGARYDDPTSWGSSARLGWVGPLPLPADPTTDSAWVRDGLLEAQAAAQSAPRLRRPGQALRRVLGGLLALPYLPVWWLTGRAARRIADGQNVIALWKFIVGVPATALALVVWFAVCQGLFGAGWVAAVSLFAGWWLWKA